MALALAEDLKTKLSDFHLADSSERDWGCFRDVDHTSAVKMIGPSTHKQHDWFDENDEKIHALLLENHCLHLIYENDLSSAAKKIPIQVLVQNKLLILSR